MTLNAPFGHLDSLAYGARLAGTDFHKKAVSASGRLQRIEHYELSTAQDSNVFRICEYSIVESADKADFTVDTQLADKAAGYRIGDREFCRRSYISKGGDWGINPLS